MVNGKLIPYKGPLPDKTVKANGDGVTLSNRYHLGQGAACLSLLEKSGIEKAPEFDFEPKAKSAILHNKALCLGQK